MRLLNEGPQSSGVAYANTRSEHARRLRSAGVSFEDRQDLLGHKNGRITTEYSAPELASLIEASNRVCGENSRKTPALTLIRTARYVASR